MHKFSEICIRKTYVLSYAIVLLHLYRTTYKHIITDTKLSHQSLELERVVDAPDEEPEGPEVLEAELKDEIRHQNKSPHHQELHVQKRTETYMACAK